MGERLGGRAKGTPNKATKAIRDMISKFVTDKSKDFVKEWEAIENPKDKAKLYLEACKFVLPSLQSVTINDETDKNKTVEDDLKALSNPQ